MSGWKVDVIADNSGQWTANGLRFADQGDAELYGELLAKRWTLVREWRVTPSDEAPNVDENTLLVLREWGAARRRGG